MIRPTIPGINCFLQRFRPRLQLAVVPGSPEFAEFGGYRLRKVVHKTMVKTQLEGGPTKRRKGYVVTRQIYAPETVGFFELAQAVRRFIAVRKVVVNEIADSPGGTESHRLRNQSIGRSLVALPEH